VQAWDRLAARAEVPYSLSRYLDACASRWDALVWGDYEFGLALPWFRRWALIPMGYTPPFMPRLDWLGSETVPSEWQQPLDKYLCGLFRRSDWVLAGRSEIQKDFQKPNYILPLKDSYDPIRLNYSEGHRRMLKKAAQAGLCLSKGDMNPIDFLDFHQKWNGEKSGREAVRRLPALLDFVLAENRGELREVRDPAGNLLAAGLFLRHRHRIINLVPVTSEAGRGPGAMHFLLDGLIREACNSDSILDFEGSLLPGVARFYAGFGARLEFFYKMSCNP
jgi:hypothetical protein